MSEHLTRSEAETTALGEKLGRLLTEGDVVLLDGPLGAGKTAFARGLGTGLGGDPADVSSPTFTIVQEYRGRVPLEHVDLYRVTPAEVGDLGLDELTEHAVVAVEWADRWPQSPADAVAVTLESLGGDKRKITIRTQN